MYTSWNLVRTLVYLSLCGSGLGFWPFDVLASKYGPDNVNEASTAKRIAIIGISTFLLHLYISRRCLLEFNDITFDQ